MTEYNGSKFFKYDIDKAQHYICEMYFGTANPTIDEITTHAGHASVAFGFLEFCQTQKNEGKQFIYISNTEHPQEDLPNPDMDIELDNGKEDTEFANSIHSMRVSMGGQTYSSLTKWVHKYRNYLWDIYYLECHDPAFSHGIFVYFK